MQWGWSGIPGAQDTHVFSRTALALPLDECSGLIPVKERQQEVWRRLLNNLPYLFKYKGTKRALHAAMSCYGVPSSMLTIMEFGGPVDVSDNGTTSFTFDDRSSALIFNGVETLTIPWKAYNSGSITTPVEYKFPNTVELRINTTTEQDQTLITAEDWELKII